MHIQKSLEKYRWLILIIYVAVMLVCLVNHELNRDEAQAWILVKNLTIPELYFKLRIEGHPFGWFAVLWPLAKLGFPFEGIGVISLIAMCVAAYWLLYRIDASIFIKLSMLASVIFFYRYTVYARPYSLCILLMLLYVSFFPRRSENPYPLLICCVLLIQLHVYMSPVGIATLLLLGWELFHDYRGKKKEYLICGIVIIVNLILLVAQLIQTGETHAEMDVSFSRIFQDIFTHPITYADGLRVIWRNNLWFFTTYNLTIRRIVAILGVVLGICMIFVIKRIPKASFVFAFSELMIFSAMLYIREESGPAYIVMMAYILMLSEQMRKNYPDAVGKRPQKTGMWQTIWHGSERAAELGQWVVLGIWILFCVISCMSAIKLALLDVRSAVSGGKEMAAYINENLPEGSIVFIENTECDVIVIAQTDPKICFYDVQQQEGFRIHDLSRLAAEETDILESLKKISAEHCYVMLNSPIENKQLLEQCELIYAQDYDVYFSGETFWLYKVRDI